MAEAKSNWSQCMIQLNRQNPSLSEDELRSECRYENPDDTFKDAEDNINGLLDYSLLSLLLLGTVTTFDQLPEQEKEQLMEEMGEKILPEIEEPVPDDLFFDEQELQELEQLLEETKQYGRMQDPKTEENTEWRNAQNINEQMGQFQYHESSVQSELNIYMGYDVGIPWTTCEDNGGCGTPGPVCEDCEDLRGELFKPDEFPEPPHYGCRCNEPMADPEPIGGDGWRSFA